MSDEFVHIPLTDIEARVQPPDHLRDAAAAKEPEPVRRVNPVPVPKGNRVTITLAPGLEYNEELADVFRDAMAAYLLKNKDAIVKRMLENTKVEK